MSWWDRLLGFFGYRTSGVEMSNEEQRAVDEFSRHLGVRLERPELMRLALTHRSFLHNNEAGNRQSNERLEFLGDSVLGLVCSEWLYRNRPREHEGQLTKTKSLLVSKAILSRRALAMGLGRFVLLSHSEVESGGRQRLSILADTFEAVIGAIYLDQGLDAARHFIQTWLLNEAHSIIADKRHTNYKSLLQEYVQSSFHTHPVYRIRSETGPDHLKVFTVEVLVGNRLLGEGRGENKKTAEQSAARDALDRVAAKSGKRSSARSGKKRSERGADRPAAEEEESPRGSRSSSGRRGRRSDRNEPRGEREGESRRRSGREEASDAPASERRRSERRERDSDRKRDRSSSRRNGNGRREVEVESKRERPPRERTSRRSREESESIRKRPEAEPEVVSASRREASPVTAKRPEEERPEPKRPEPKRPEPKSTKPVAEPATETATQLEFGRIEKPAVRGLHSQAARADLLAANQKEREEKPTAAESGVTTPTRRGGLSRDLESLSKRFEVPDVEIVESGGPMPAGADADRYRVVESGPSGSVSRERQRRPAETEEAEETSEP